MTTTKPIATISYNSIPFLLGILNNLLRNKIIRFYAFVRHFAEDDDLKDHCHLYIEPRVRIDADELKDMFNEFDIEHPDKPLGCMIFNNSKWDDWLLYSLHFRPYLVTKALVKKYSYDIGVFYTNDEVELMTRYNRTLSESNLIEKQRVNKLLDSGYTVNELTYMGIIPMRMALQAKCYGDLFTSGRDMLIDRREKDSKAICDDENNKSAP